MLQIQMRKSAARINLSKILFFSGLQLLGFIAFSQTKDNQVNQNGAKGTNAQIGNGNTIKTDNRKNYNNETIIHNETSTLNGPLIAGNNPFVVVNNIYPNRDSINYEIQVKKKNIRMRLAEFMMDGKELQIKCLTDTNYTLLVKKVDVWVEKVRTYLSSNLDFAYEVQFALADHNDILSTLTMHASPKMGNLYNAVRVRVAKIDEFISSLY